MYSVYRASARVRVGGGRCAESLLSKRRVKPRGSRGAPSPNRQIDEHDARRAPVGRCRAVLKRVPTSTRRPVARGGELATGRTGTDIKIKQRQRTRRYKINTDHGSYTDYCRAARLPRRLRP
jgi:hypothetical protein